MRKIYLLSTLVLTIFIGRTSFAQDFSNKGKNFWVGYGYHTSMIPVNGNSQQMVLYFATDQVTNITISIPAVGYTQTLTSPAGNNVLTSAIIPKTGAQDSRLLTEGTSNNGIHITSDKPMVAYAHIYNGNCSGATILYPTNTLGRECYSVNYKNWSNATNANCWFYVVATDTGTTTLKIKPSANTTGGWLPGNTYTVSLTQGQIYNVMGVLTGTGNPNTGVDLTGSKIESINTGSGCKKIAVFSGSGRISITCNSNSSSSDNYMVQAMPKNAWGKKYLTTQANGNQSNNIYRVCVSNPAAIVRINGAVTGLPLINNFYYEIPATNQPLLIESDSAIMVAQYFTSQGACGNGATPGDPEVIYLSAVEQSISRVLWNATPNFAITAHHFNVVIPNTGTALSSFRLDGGAVGGFVTHPQDPGYSYLRQAVSPGFHIIQSDSGFNAIAYGFGGAESYGYNAGTNIRDLYQQIGVQTEYGIEPTPSVCTGAPFKFKVSLPYLADSIYWDLSNLPGPPANVMMRYPPNVPDSSTIVNGKTIYWYSLPSLYTFNIVGVFPVNITTYSPNGECGTEQEIDFDLTVSDPPVADFAWSGSGCVAEPYQFTETTPQTPKPTYRFWWDFGDPLSGAANNSLLRNPTHLFSAPGTYTVRYASITTPGCLSDTISHTVIVPPLPSATIAGNATVCINSAPQPVITFTGADGTPEYVFSYNINGGATLTATSTGGVATVLAPTNVAGTFRYNLLGIRNQIPASTLCTQSYSNVFVDVTISPDATITLTSATGTDNQTVCINTPIINITYAVGGSGTGGSVTGLPAGVTGTFAGGVITITGTPSVPGTFTYTITTTGPCVTPSATGVITVTDDATISLTSAAGTDNQTICINTPLIDITYAVSGGGTGGSVSGLPAGVTGTFAGGVITITGTPSVSGIFNYIVTTTGPCATPSATGTITVTANATISLTSAAGTDNQTVCINTPIINITYSVGGSGTGGSVSGLPAGVTGTFAGGIITITGTPSVPGTFTYTITTTGPCVTPSATGVITVTDNATIILTSATGTDNQTICINTPLTTITYSVGGSGTGGSVTGLPAGVTGTFAGGIISITGTPSVSGTFNYTVITTGPCIVPTATGTITVTANATITLTSATGTDNQTVCINTPIINITYSVGGSGTGGSVSGLPAGVTGTFAGGVITITGSPSTTAGSPFTYIVSTTGPCVIPTTTGTITVNPDATITLTSAPPTTAQELCLNTAITNITYSVGGGGAGATVAGLPAGVTGVYAGGIFTISGTATVSGVFNYTVTTTGICIQATATGTITINALPTSNFNFTAPSCETRTINFFDISVPNSGNIISWAWNFGDPPSGINNTSTLQNPSHTFATSGTYNVTLVVTTDKGCVSIQPSRQVIIDERPLAGYIVPEVCLSDTYAQFTDTSSIAAPDNIVAWAWNFGDPPSGPLNTSNLQNPQHSYTATGAYIVELIATSNKGCKDTVTHTLFVNGSFPVADFTVNNPTTLCANDSVSIVEASTVFPGTITKVEIYWDNVGFPGVFDTDNFPVTGKVYKHLYPNFQTPLTRTFTIRYRAYSGGVCVNDRLRTITVNAAPLVQFNNMPDVCLDAAPFQITQASEIGGVPGTGVFTGPGVSPGGIFNPASVGPGTYTIKYTFTSTAGGCVDSLSKPITVLDSASARFTYSALACERSAVDFSSVTSTIPPASGTITGWTWNFGDPGSGASNTSASQNPSHIFSGWGTYNVTLFVTTSNGCRSTVRTIPVFVNPLARPNFTTPVSSCLPSANVTFTNASTIPDGTQASFSYLWNFDDPPSGILNTATGSSPSHIYNTTGPFNVNLQVTSGAGCVHDTTILLNTIHPEPTGAFIANKDDVCVGQSFTFTDNSDPADGTTQQYSWSMGDGNTRTTPVVNYTYGTAGTYTITLFTTNSHGCRSSIATKTVTVNPYPSVNAGPDLFILQDGSDTLEPIITAITPTYLWTPNMYFLSSNTIKNPVVKGVEDITYTIIVTGRGDCISSDQVFIKVLKGPEIPNIFSPNGDGVHDKWEIKYLDTYPGGTVEIFNRYGQMIFRSVGYGTPWDGTIGGTPVPIGTYYYIVNPKNGRKQMSGYVDVIR